MPVASRPTFKAIVETPWALLPAHLSLLIEGVRAGAMPPSDQPAGGASRAGSVSVIAVHGVIEHRADWLLEMFGGTSIDNLRATLRSELADPAVRAIILDIDSPGGTVAGTTEFAAEIRAARGGEKPIIAVANTLAASAAYWLASSADEIVATPSAQVGSIGVYAIHQETSRMLDEMGVTTTVISAGPHKTEGNEFEPLSDEARAAIQDRVDASYGQFLSDVAAGRRTTVAEVEQQYGGGRVFTATQARAAGMVDRVATLEATIARVVKAAGSGRRQRAEDLLPDLEAGATDMPADPPGGQVPTLAERLVALAHEADDLVEAVTERARVRLADRQPPISTVTEKALRVSRDAIDALLSPGEPEPDAAVEPPGDPVMAAAPSTPPPAAPIRRFRSDEDWLAFIQETR